MEAPDAMQLDAMEEGARMQYLGNGLYPRIATLVGDALAGKITGMLLEMPTAQLVTFMEQGEALKAAVGDAVAALPTDMLDLLGQQSEPEMASPTSPMGNPSPVSVMNPEPGWADACDEDEEAMPHIDDMLASAERKRSLRQSKEDDDAMDTDDAFVCEWDAAEMAAQEPMALCAFIADRLREPHVRIVRSVVELLGAETALGLLRETEHALFLGGMLVEETGKPRSPGGICA